MDDKWSDIIPLKARYKIGDKVQLNALGLKFHRGEVNEKRVFTVVGIYEDERLGGKYRVTFPNRDGTIYSGGKDGYYVYEWASKLFGTEERLETLKTIEDYKEWDRLSKIEYDRCYSNLKVGEAIPEMKMDYKKHPLNVLINDEYIRRLKAEEPKHNRNNANEQNSIAGRRTLGS